MNLDDYFNFLAPNDIRLKGSRIGIETILYDFIHNGHSPETIADRYRTLSREQIYATITWYLHNQERADAYLTEWLEHGERMRREQAANPSPGMLKLRKILAARRQAQREAATRDAS